MNWPHVRDRIRDGKGARTEFKQGASAMRAVAKAVCAFANGTSMRVRRRPCARPAAEQMAVWWLPNSLPRHARVYCAL